MRSAYEAIVDAAQSDSIRNLVGFTPREIRGIAEAQGVSVRTVQRWVTTGQEQRAPRRVDWTDGAVAIIRDAAQRTFARNAESGFRRELDGGNIKRGVKYFESSSREAALNVLSDLMSGRRGHFENGAAAGARLVETKDGWMIEIDYNRQWTYSKNLGPVGDDEDEDLLAYLAEWDGEVAEDLSDLMDMGLGDLW